MELLVLLLVLLGLWGLFIWLCSRVGGWIGSTLYDILHNGQASQDTKQFRTDRQEEWKTKISEPTKKGDGRSDISDK